MSPATMNWLQSLAKSASSESLSGLVSPAALSFSGSAGGLSVIEGSSSAGGSSTTQGGIPRSPSCEMIDWKAYNDACGTAEKTQKEPPKWRVIPQHGPHADPTSAANAAATYGNGQAATRPPPGAGSNPQGMVQSDGGLRTHFTRQLQTIKSTVVSLVGALGATDPTTAPDSTAASSSRPRTQHDPTLQPMPLQHPHHQQSQLDPAHIVLPPEVLMHHHQQQQAAYGMSAQRLADEKNKRKAIISPEYVQYGTGVSHGATSSSMPPPGAPSSAIYGGMPTPPGSENIKYEVVNGQIVGQVQYATQVPDPRGRRPSKKTLHQADSYPSPTYQSQLHFQGHYAPAAGTAYTDDEDDTASVANSTTSSTNGSVSSTAVRCKCTGKCRNARCACVKAGFVCGVHCKCVSCANPFVPMEREGIDIQVMVQDVCLMQYLSKVKDMQELLDSTVPYDCCHGTVQVKETVERGFTCPKCQAHYTYSWCNNRLCHDQKRPRKHCAKCRRCGDHRNEHCEDCNHCYFAGVANSFSCSCKSGKNGSSGGNASNSTASKASGGAGESSSPPTSERRKGDDPTDDENSNPQVKGDIAAGLSNAEQEKDDSCPVQ
ncbi:hypothetical protein PINS_up000983 [Pythium insidiosum]|nr:hypothetical protein PINS_up000983 [Pythium insidiosum]